MSLGGTDPVAMSLLGALHSIWNSIEWISKGILDCLFAQSCLEEMYHGFAFVMLHGRLSLEWLNRAKFA